MGSIQDNQNQQGILDSLDARTAIDGFIRGLPAEANILLVGCEASVPLAVKLTEAGHHVCGIDISKPSNRDAMLGDQFFQTADMRDYSTGNLDAIVAVFSTYHLTGAQTYSQLFKFSEWLKPGGRILLGTSVIDSLSLNGCHDCVDERVRCYPVQCLGKQMVAATILSKKGWAGMASNAGLSVEKEVDVVLGQSERHYFVTFCRTEQKHPLMGPYPLPQSYRGPHRLSEAAWHPFASRLVRDEFDFVLDVLKHNQKVLDVGSGYGKLPKEVAARTGKAYSIEPNPDRNSIQATNAENAGIELAQGTAENIPFPDSTFDAVVAMWVLHYVDDLEKSLHEMARVADRSAPNARLVVVQGAPDNEIIHLMNTVCPPISATNGRPNHQGYLLSTAAEIFTKCGFEDVSVHRVDAFCEFRDEDLEERCDKAAEVVAGLWCLDDAKFDDMKQALVPRLRFHFLDRQYAVGDQAVVLVAKPL
ncbi:hypothetical protein ASPWEDRAFT_115782 [Aspergillus wentii DTO 134E9]|uniref:Methyltransferase type 11 domain-containing protein n=1 Tax=Aspergillus wentii DTO 134E9 TaxID=1073089 RepID=A0A1L9REY5_ASPWE|nr:uncharacterized protein ASPWEDRAFT_115782 [Aspergillus wentii DTO 134E9]KAI9926166.1 hypothetical protein MW887_004629 [Aspergillus wentii]OJJ33485.1 hypothetical protein ASPWEDRAFT_115782 [Aspergillus wentii DTO 134E9]